MRLALVPVFALVALWTCAAWLWPQLPERIPLHFDAHGTPDDFMERTPFAWFLLPGIATVLALVFAFALPRWIRHLAATNASYLSVPRQQDFAALEPAARVRAIEPLIGMLQLVAAELTLLFMLILFGSAKVASGYWSRLPSLVVWPAVLLLLATALGSIPIGMAAVEREKQRARG